MLHFNIWAHVTFQHVACYILHELSIGWICVSDGSKEKVYITYMYDITLKGFPRDGTNLDGTDDYPDILSSSQSKKANHPT